MKIGFDAKRAFLNHTGLGNYSRFIINALSQHYPDNEYFLFTPKEIGLGEADNFYSRPNIKIKTPSKLISAFKLNSFWRTYRLNNIAAKNEVKILHGLSNELPLDVTSKPLRKIVTIHDLLFLRYPQLYSRVDVELYKYKFRYACHNADKIVAVSKQTAEDIVNYFKVDPEKIEVIYQGCLPYYKKEYDPIRLMRVKDKYQLPGDFILNVGTIEARKNVLLIIKALSLNKKIDIPLVIIGKVTKYKNEIVKLAAKEGLSNRVIFLHHVSFEDLPKIYQMAKVFVYPSLFEGFGIPIIEALNSKVPVITSKGGCFPEAGGPGSLYVNPEDPLELSDSIYKVLNNSVFSAKMIEVGLQHVRQFEEDSIAKKLMTLYEKVLDNYMVIDRYQ